MTIGGGGTLRGRSPSGSGVGTSGSPPEMSISRAASDAFEERLRRQAPVAGDSSNGSSCAIGITSDPAGERRAKVGVRREFR